MALCLIKNGLACWEENKVYLNHIKGQRDHRKDPVSSKEAIFGLNSTTIKAVSQTVAVGQEDKKSFISLIHV